VNTIPSRVLKALRRHYPYGLGDETTTLGIIETRKFSFSPYNIKTALKNIKSIIKAMDEEE